MAKEIKQQLKDMIGDVKSDGANRAVAIILALQANEELPITRLKSFKIDWCTMGNGSIFPEIDMEFHPS